MQDNVDCNPDPQLILAICSNLFQTSGPDRLMEPMEMEVKHVKTELPATDVDRTPTAEVAEPVVPVVAPLDTELEAKAAKPEKDAKPGRPGRFLGVLSKLWSFC